MGNFLRENWIWILAPILVVGVLVVLSLFWGRPGGANFDYPIF